MQAKSKDYDLYCDLYDESGEYVLVKYASMHSCSNFQKEDLIRQIKLNIENPNKYKVSKGNFLQVNNR